ncbi:hypothetical protein G352_10312 [Rhodococcus ruber BKS 20-38]|uniref:Uncharacterized protein n=1 Tax=Rhodococcus ruber BKS 20-38 TaxID=1278076 RepID=M2ZDK8_9NOCA|nr:hypothetical protein [Rhodococcus ruber]EME65372.1 hypothetical protein G352_10312 [Rhodococcus ruber BKS 20-38]
MSEARMNEYEDQDEQDKRLREAIKRRNAKAKAEQAAKLGMTVEQRKRSLARQQPRSLEDTIALLEPWLCGLFAGQKGYIAVTFGRKPLFPHFFPDTRAGRKALITKAYEAQKDGKSNVYINGTLWASYEDGSPIESGEQARCGLSAANFLPAAFTHLWVDVDEPTKMNDVLLQRLKQHAHTIVRSGSFDGDKPCIHGRFMLATPWDGSRAEDFEGYLRGLAADLGGDQAVSHIAGWLRLPQMISWPKPGKCAERSFVRVSATKFDRGGLAETSELLRKRLSTSNARTRTANEEIVAQELTETRIAELDRDKYNFVRGMVRSDKDPGDDTERYKRTKLLVATCAEAGMTKNETLALLEDHDPSVAKFGLRRLPSQVHACWPRETPGANVEFWQARPELQHIYDTARAVGRSPQGVLGVVLARTAADIPPNVVLPDLTGAYGSLNLFIALYGWPGSGKSASVEAGKTCVQFHKRVMWSPAGSGEGIPRHFAMRKDGQIVGKKEAVIIEVDEINQIRALFANRTSTLKPALLSAFSAKGQGFANADETKSVPVASHRYRLCFVTGTQPDNTDVLFNDAGSGWPQRFLWFPVKDRGVKRDRALKKPDALFHEEREGEPDVPFNPAWENFMDVDRRPDEFYVLDLPDEAIEAVYEADDADGPDDALDGHAIFMRLKVAAILMWLNGRRKTVSLEDWELAGEVMAMSDHTRGEAQREYAKRQRAARTAQAREDGVDEATKKQASADSLLASAIKRYRDLIPEIPDTGWGGAVLKTKLGGGPRAEFHQAALDFIVSEGELEREKLTKANGEPKGFKYYRPGTMKG